SDVSKLYSALAIINSGANRYYPKTIAAIDSATRAKDYTYSGVIPNADDPNGRPYAYLARSDGRGFSLSVTFETDQAVSQIEKVFSQYHSIYSSYATGTNASFYQGYGVEPAVDGKKVVFTEASGQYGRISIPPTIPKPTILALSDYMDSMPSTILFTASLSGTYERPQNALPSNSQAVLDVSGTFDDLSVSADVEVRKVASDYYVIVNKFPSILFLSLLSPIKGKWVKISPASSTAPGAAPGGLFSGWSQSLNSTQKSFSDNGKMAAQDLRTLASIADQTHALKFSGDPVKDQIDGALAYRYDLVLEKQDLLAFLQALAAEQAKPGHSPGFSTFPASSMIQYLESSDSGPTMDFLSKNMFFTVWVDAQGMPIQERFRFRMVPPDSASQLAGKQVDLTFTATFSDINKPISVQAPSSYITSEEADKLLSNTSAGTAQLKGRDARIVADIEQLRTDAESNYANGTYSKALVANNSRTSQGAGIVSSGDRKQILSDIASNGSTAYAITGPGPTSYALYGQLVSDPTQYICIDSSGKLLDPTTNHTGKTCK
ncbi:MAG: hypothetical protein KGI66_04740, partial [Patescibacteria group bacterium]|nr:hypothetical protein [Patescibacteria group bacterium]